MKRIFMIFVIVFGIIGLGLLGTAAAISIDNAAFKANGVTTTAQIIGKHSSGTDVVFMVDGDEMQASLTGTISSEYIGQDVNIVFNPQNPGEVRRTGASIFGFVLYPLGSIFTLVAVMFVLIAFQPGQKRRRAKLMEQGVLVYAQFARVERNMMLQVNRQVPFKIACFAPGPDGREIWFRSQNLWNDPTFDIQRLQITHFAVYYDAQKPSRHYMPLDELVGFPIDI